MDFLDELPATVQDAEQQAAQRRKRKSDKPADDDDRPLKKAKLAYQTRFPHSYTFFCNDILGSDVAEDLKPEALERRFNEFIDELGKSPLDWGDVALAVSKGGIWPEHYDADYYSNDIERDTIYEMVDALRDDGFKIDHCPSESDVDSDES